MWHCPYGLLWVSAFFCCQRCGTELGGPRVWLSLTTGVVRVLSELWTAQHSGSSTPGTIVTASVTKQMALKSLIPSRSQFLPYLTKKKKSLESEAVFPLLILEIHGPNHTVYSLVYFVFRGPSIFMILIFPLLLEESKQAKSSTTFLFISQACFWAFSPHLPFQLINLSLQKWLLTLYNEWMKMRHS